MHDESVDLMGAIESGIIEAETSVLELIEIQWVLTSFYGVPKAKVVTLLQSIEATPHLRIRKLSSVIEAVDLYAENNVKFVDANIAADSDGLTIISYDHDFQKLPCSVCTPGEVLHTIDER